VITLPGWIPAEQWAGYIEMRKKIRKPMTERAIKMAITTLDCLRETGNDPGAVLDQSTFNSWQGLFALKQEEKKAQSRFTSLGKQGQVTANNLQDWLEEA